MNGADLAVLAILTFFAVRGYRTGLVHEAMTVAAAGAGLLLALRWTEQVSVRVADVVPGPPEVATSLVFLFLFSLAFVAGRKIEIMVRRTWIEAGRSSTNRLAGLSFGMLEGAIVTGFLVMGLQRFGPGAAAYDPEDASMEGRVAAVHRQVEESHLARGMADLTGGMFSALMDTAEGRMRVLASGGGEDTADGR